MGAAAALQTRCWPVPALPVVAVGGGALVPELEAVAAEAAEAVVAEAAAHQQQESPDCAHDRDAERGVDGSTARWDGGRYRARSVWR